MSFARSSLHPSLASPPPRNSVVTHPSLHIRDAHDAHVVLEAVRQNILPIIRRRLLSGEREELKSGHVYVWEEAQDEGGLLRWTDGRRWSQSRMRGDYLFYEEKVETTQEERDAKAARRARRASDPNAVLPAPTRRKDRPSKPDGLTKQTYSVAVQLPGIPECRKWHVVAYFSGKDYNRLPVIEDYHYLRSIRVPPGIFMSSKVLNNRMDRFSHFSDENENYDSSTRFANHHHTSSSPQSPSTSSSSMSPSLSPTEEPMAMSPRRHQRILPNMATVRTPDLNHHQQMVLPPLTTTLGNPMHRPASVHPRHYPNQVPHGRAGYTPLTPEDRRALEKLRVVL